MAAHYSYTKPEYRERMSTLMRGNSQLHIATLAAAEHNRIRWTVAMHATLLEQYCRGRSVLFIAEEIGVARTVIDKEMTRLELPRGRWITTAQRRAAARRHMA